MSVKDLHSAIQKHDVERVTKILKNDPDVNCTYFQETALTRAVRGQLDEIVNVLLEYQYTDVNIGNQFDRTPLYFASLNGQVNLVVNLLERGSDVNCSDVAGVTPLGASAYYDNWQTAEFLIRAGGTVNLLSKKDESPLYRACYYLSLNVVKVLINNGCNVNLKTTDGKTALMAAIVTTDENNNTSKYKRFEILKLLLQNGAYIDAHDIRLFTALHYAAEGNKLDVCSLLMKHGCNLYSINNKNMSAFGIAISEEKQYFQLAILFYINGFHLKELNANMIKSILFKSKYTEPDNSDRILLLSVVLDDAMGYENFTRNLHGIFEDKEIDRFDTTCLNMIRTIYNLNASRTLKNRCRWIIRYHLRLPFLYNLTTLEIPNDLHKYLAYNIDEHQHFIINNMNYNSIVYR